MPMYLTLANGTALSVIADQSLDTVQTTLTLVGKGFVGYTEFWNQNLLGLLTHFASPAAPLHPLLGQLWYDQTAQGLRMQVGVNGPDAGVGGWSKLLITAGTSSLQRLAFTDPASDIVVPAVGTLAVPPALVLKTVNSNVGTFSVVTVNAKGLVTAARAVAIADISGLLDTRYVQKTGDTMTGALWATAFRATQGAPNLADSSTAGYAFGNDGDTGLFSPLGLGAIANNGELGLFSNNLEIFHANSAAALFKVPARALTPVSSDNSNAIATTAFVQTQGSAYVKKTGDTMTGPLSFANQQGLYFTSTNNHTPCIVLQNDNDICFYSTHANGDLRSYMAIFTDSDGANLRLGGFGVGPTSPLQNNVAVSAPTVASSDNSSNVATTAWVQSQNYATVGGRIRLTALLNLYVNASTGSDANTGLTPSTAFLSIQAAYDHAAQSYDLGGFSVTLNLADGTYTPGCTAVGPLVGQYAGTVITIVGNAANPANVVVNSAVGWTNTFNCTGGARIQLTGFTVTSAGIGQGGFCIVAQTAGYVFTSNMIFGTAVAGHILANFGGYISVDGPYSVAGSTNAHLVAGQGGQISFDTGAPFTITVAAGLSFPGGFANVDSASTISFSEVTFSPVAATGPRYTIVRGGAIIGTGSDANFFPGSAAGTAVTGYYA